MAFQKNVLILKQVTEGYALSDKKVSGIIRLEKEDGNCELSLSLINFSFISGGEYRLFLLDGKNLSDFNLGSRPSSFTSETENFFPEDFSVGVFFIKDDLPVLVAYAKTENCKAERADLIKSVAENILARKKAEKKAEESIKKDKTEEVLYNDEVVATEDYFSEDVIDEKLKVISLMDENYVRTENAMPSFGGENETEKKEPLFDCFKNETDKDSRRKYSEEFPYYDTVKDELENLFLKFPEESSLCQCVANSRWAKIYYSDEKYYVVGVIKEKGKEKYICYGVPDFYSSNPPKELDGFCSFVPISVFDLKGRGFWMMFQDAVTGECIKK